MRIERGGFIREVFSARFVINFFILRLVRGFLWDYSVSCICVFCICGLRGGRGNSIICFFRVRRGKGCLRIFWGLVGLCGREGWFGVVLSLV